MFVLGRQLHNYNIKCYIYNYTIERVVPYYIRYLNRDDSPKGGLFIGWVGTFWSQQRHEKTFKRCEKFMVKDGSNHFTFVYIYNVNIYIQSDYRDIYI